LLDGRAYLLERGLSKLREECGFVGPYSEAFCNLVGRGLLLEEDFGGEHSAEMVGESADYGVLGGFVGCEHISEAVYCCCDVFGQAGVNDGKGVEEPVLADEGLDVGGGYGFFEGGKYCEFVDFGVEPAELVAGQLD